MTAESALEQARQLPTKAHWVHGNLETIQVHEVSNVTIARAILDAEIQGLEWVMTQFSVTMELPIRGRVKAEIARLRTEREKVT